MLESEYKTLRKAYTKDFYKRNGEAVNNFILVVVVVIAIVILFIFFYLGPKLNEIYGIQDANQFLI